MKKEWMSPELQMLELNRTECINPFDPRNNDRRDKDKDKDKCKGKDKCHHS